MNELFEYIDEATKNAKEKRMQQLARFHIGDVVYPLYQTWKPVIWGTVIEINADIHKIIVNLNGIVHQYDPEELVLANPELKPDSKYNKEREKMIEDAEKKIKASFSGIRKSGKRFKADIMFYKDVDDNQVDVPQILTIMAPDLETAKKIIDEMCQNKMFEDGFFDYSVQNINGCEPEKSITAAEFPKETSEKSKIMPAYRVWKHDIRQCAVTSDKKNPTPTQYDEFIADCLNEIGLAENAGKNLDMSSFKEHLINSVFAFKSAYEFGRLKLSGDSLSKLEKANYSCMSLSNAMNLNI